MTYTVPGTERTGTGTIESRPLFRIQKRQIQPACVLPKTFHFQIWDNIV
jgi:hypothetical protein